MDQSIVKPTCIRRNLQHIMMLPDEFAKAGISVEEFCARHNIGKSTFHKWQSRYRNNADRQRASAGFADIHIIRYGEHTAALFAEVNGIKLYRPVAAAYLKELPL